MARIAELVNNTEYMGWICIYLLKKVVDIEIILYIIVTNEAVNFRFFVCPRGGGCVFISERGAFGQQYQCIYQLARTG